MNKTFFDCKQNGNTIVSKPSGNNHFFAILCDGVYYEFIINKKGEVISVLQSLKIPDYLSNAKLGIYQSCCLGSQMN